MARQEKMEVTEGRFMERGTAKALAGKGAAVAREDSGLPLQRHAPPFDIRSPERSSMENL